MKYLMLSKPLEDLSYPELADALSPTSAWMASTSRCVPPVMSCRSA